MECKLRGVLLILCGTTFVLIAIIKLDFLDNNFQKLINSNGYKTLKNNSNEEQQLFSKWENIMTIRRNLIKSVCKRYSRQLHRYINPQNFASDLSKGILYCKNAKAGTTSWLGILLKWSDAPIPAAEDIRLTSMRILPNVTSEDYAKAHYTFTSVRHPYTRLVSAYRDKIPEDYRKELQREIINTYRLQNGNESTYASKWREMNHILGLTDKHPSFEEFIQYVSDRILNCQEGIINVACMSQIDPHWRPYYDRCGPCDTEYDVISQVETFEDDLDYLSQMLKEKYLEKEEESSFGSNMHRGYWKKAFKVSGEHAHKSSGISTSTFTKKLFGLLSPKVKANIYKAFRFDFMLFGYDPNKF